MSDSKLAEALRLGQVGAAPTEEERLLFEAWMQGHCWKIGGVWNGKQYVDPAEADGYPRPQEMLTRQLFAAWRDRGALAAHEAEQQAGGELARERSARQAAQIELERYKALLARSRLDLMRELREHGWRNPGEQQAGEAVAWVDERVIAWLAGRGKSATITTTLQACKSFERPMPLFTRPLQPLSERERELLDGLIERELHHAAQCDGIANRRMAEKQKGWDMERVALLHKLGGITKDTK